MSEGADGARNEGARGESAANESIGMSDRLDILSLSLVIKKLSNIKASRSTSLSTVDCSFKPSHSLSSYSLSMLAARRGEIRRRYQGWPFTLALQRAIVVLPASTPQAAEPLPSHSCARRTALRPQAVAAAATAPSSRSSRLVRSMCPHPKSTINNQCFVLIHKRMVLDPPRFMQVLLIDPEPYLIFRGPVRPYI